MTRVSFTTHIARPPIEVFDLLSDITRNAEWSPGFAGAKKTTAGPIRRGTAFTAVAKGMGTLKIQIEEYQRPVRLGFRAAAPAAQISHYFTLTAQAAGTRVAQRIDVRPQGPRRIIAPILALMLKRNIRRNTADLTRYLETHQLGGKTATADRTG